eukprot:359953-Chlamydomonas_euryale.AAC.6
MAPALVKAAPNVEDPRTTTPQHRAMWIEDWRTWPPRSHILIVTRPLVIFFMLNPTWTHRRVCVSKEAYHAIGPMTA